MQTLHRSPGHCCDMPCTDVAFLGSGRSIHDWCGGPEGWAQWEWEGEVLGCRNLSFLQPRILGPLTLPRKGGRSLFFAGGGGVLTIEAMCVSGCGWLSGPILAVASAPSGCRNY
jgi:hypothetical protein